MANEQNLRPKPFKKGQSGNPKGRPKGSKNLKTVLRELLSAKDPEGEWANPVSQRLIKKAFEKDDYKALVEIIDRIEGKAKDKTEHSGEISHNIFSEEMKRKAQEIDD